VRNEALRIAKERIERSEEDSVRQAMTSLVELGGEPAAQLVVSRLRRGLPPQLIESALDALVLLGRPSAAPAVLELMQHARAPIRKRAADALAALKVKSAQSALLFALDDPSAEVREAAVQALGTVGDTRALPALFVTLDRGNRTALSTIGAIAGPSHWKELNARAANGDVSMIKPALVVMMQRATYPVAAKLKLVRELEKLATPSARTLLVEWLDAYKTAGSPALRKALFDSIKRLDALEKEKSKQVVTTEGRP
jgi:HEAT repeat protein